MRFVLYFFTWTFVLSTVGNLTAGDYQGFGTGVVLSGLMLWWSKTVRDKRRAKLGIAPKNLGKKTTRLNRAIRAAGEAWATPASSASSEAAEPNSKTEPVVEIASPSPASPAAEVEPVTVSPAVEEVAAAEIVPQIESEPQGEEQELEAQPAEANVSEAVATQPDLEVSESSRQFWRDSKGNNLNVGSQVSFLANSRGETVSIAGVLLGERDGKALIEVQKGALLPANDYAIPWSVVSLRG